MFSPPFYEQFQIVSVFRQNVGDGARFDFKIFCKAFQTYIIIVPTEQKGPVFFVVYKLINRVFDFVFCVFEITHNNLRKQKSRHLSR